MFDQQVWLMARDAKAVSAPMPLRSLGPYASAIQGQMLAHLVPSEELVGRIVDWESPVRSLAWPSPASDVASAHVSLGISPLGLHVWFLRHVDDNWTVKSHNFIELGAIGSIKLTQARRVMRPSRSFRRGRDEEVILARLWIGTGRAELFFESVFLEAKVQGLALTILMKDGETARIRSGNQPATPTSSSDLSSELAELDELYRRGALSYPEWVQAKARYLGPAPDRKADALATLARLHQLLLTGAISEHEYQRKKLELLTW